MKYELITSGDLQRITKCSIEQIRMLVTADILMPVEGGEKRGRFRLFNKMQAVALAYAMNWLPFCDLKKLAKPVFDSILSMTEEELLESFAEGYTHLIPHCPDESLDGPDAPEEEVFSLVEWEYETGQIFNLKAVYEQVGERLHQLVRGYEGSAKPAAPGRRTGMERVAEENVKNKRKS